MHFIGGMHRVKFHDENDMDRRGNNGESNNRYGVHGSPSQSARKNIYSKILATTLLSNNIIPFAIIPCLRLQNSNARGQGESHG